MAHSKKIEVLPPAEEPEEMPLPSDPKAVFLGGLFFLALLAAAYVAREVIMPLTFAVVLALLLQPALRLLERLRITADARGAAPNLCAPWNDRRLRYGHFRPGPQLGR